MKKKVILHVKEQLQDCSWCIKSSSKVAPSPSTYPHFTLVGNGGLFDVVYLNIGNLELVKLRFVFCTKDDKFDTCLTQTMISSEKS